MGATVDHDATRSADAFPAVVREGDRLDVVLDESFIDHVEHLEKRRVDGYPFGIEVHECPGRAG